MSLHQKSSKPYHPQPVAIIGAGVSGASCAWVLKNQGMEITVFDKGRGPGGRSSTRQEGELHFDHGAQYFTERGDRFRQYAEEWLKEGIVAPWDAKFGVLRGGRVALLEDQPVRYVGVPGMNALASYLTASCDVQQGVEVLSVVSEGNAWRLTSVDGVDLGSYQAVLVSTPPSQAAQLLGGAQDFSKLAARIPMTPCWAVMVAFEAVLDVQFDGAFVENSPLRWIARNSSKPGRMKEPDCWVLHASPEWSHEHLDLEADKVILKLVEAFFEATGHGNVTPLMCKAHRWRYARPTGERKTLNLYNDSFGIGACGDWLVDGRIEGAFLSGMSLARRLLKLNFPTGY